MVSRADDGGTDGFPAAHILALQQLGMTDGLPQQNTQIPIGQRFGRVIGVDEVGHAAGERENRTASF